MATAASLGYLDIHVACLTGNEEEVAKLITSNHEKSYLRTLDGHKSTPLMLAGLFGHMAVVTLLIVRSGDFLYHDTKQRASYTNARDLQGRKAADYCGENAFAATKRAFFLQNGLGCESPLGPDARLEVALLFKYPGRIRALKNGSAVEDNESLFHKRGSQILEYVLVNRFEAGNAILAKSKTFGSIKVKGDIFSRTMAISGYKVKPGKKERDHRVLNAEEQIKCTFMVAKKIGFRFKGNMRDNGNKKALPHHKGRFQAGHMEIEIACFYAMEMIKEILRMPSDVSMGDLVRNLDILRRANLGRKRRAIIQLDYGPCKYCCQFLRRLSQYTKLSFEIKVRPLIVFQYRNDIESAKKAGQMAKNAHQLESAKQVVEDCSQTQSETLDEQILGVRESQGFLEEDDGYDTDGTLEEEVQPHYENIEDVIPQLTTPINMDIDRKLTQSKLERPLSSSAGIPQVMGLGPVPRRSSSLDGERSFQDESKGRLMDLKERCRYRVTNPTPVLEPPAYLSHRRYRNLQYQNSRTSDGAEGTFGDNVNDYIVWDRRTSPDERTSGSQAKHFDTRESFHLSEEGNTIQSSRSGENGDDREDSQLSDEDRATERIYLIAEDQQQTIISPLSGKIPQAEEITFWDTRQFVPEIEML